ncbi:LpxI family protein [Rubripirellula amarantea]|nr:UDP-2,3-diacylglucosamine diphosphatase LpxI [Rubripirellula amarantea]
MSQSKSKIMRNDAKGYWPRRGHVILSQRASQDPLPPVGLIAGWGRFPVEVAEALVRDGRRVACVAIRGHASSELESICDHVWWSGIGKLGGHIAYFRRSGVQDVTMAGKIFKAEVLYGGSLWLRHFPDLTCLRTFGPHLFGRRRDARDDSLLTAVVNTYDRMGMTIRSATDLAPELLMKRSQLSGGKISTSLQSDIETGWHVAKQMGGMDIGQTITIKDGTVLAVEAIEGTDACIKRTGELCRRGGWTLVKVSKPDQDMRFDVPTIGPQTIQMVRQAGGKAIVVEAEKTIIVDREVTLQAAKDAGITLVAFDDASLSTNNGSNPEVSSSETNCGSIDGQANIFKQPKAA